MGVVAVTVSYNTRDLTAQLVWSLHRHGGPLLHGIVVVDNGSTDGSPELLADARVCTLVANATNRYHGPALNQGVDVAVERWSPDLVWVLDSDCVVLRSGVLEWATAAMGDAGLGGQVAWDEWQQRDQIGLHSLLLDPRQVWRPGIERFQEDGDPSAALQRSADAAGVRRADLPFTRDHWIVHVGRGSLASVARNDERANRYHAWAVDHAEPHYAAAPGAAAAHRRFLRRFRAAVPRLEPEAFAATIAAMSSDRLERILADDYTAGAGDLTLEEVRARRAECQEVELGLSYARRIVQGRLDIIHAELERRGSGAGPSDASDLVDRLKEGEMLGDHSRPAGFGRLPTLMAPDEASDEFSSEIDEIADPDSLANLPELDDAAVANLADQLTQLERSLSERRRLVFDRIDTFQAEIVNRYKTGSANPDELLT